MLIEKVTDMNVSEAFDLWGKLEKDFHTNADVAFFSYWTSVWYWILINFLLILSLSVFPLRLYHTCVKLRM